MSIVSKDRNTKFANATSVMGKVKSYMAHSSAARQLHQLDDRMLADIGVRRGEIDARVWG